MNGDGKSDTCGRAAAGVVCELSSGTGFPTEIMGPAWSDATHFNEPQYYTTFGAADVNDDGMDDLCVRSSTGVDCAPSTGTAFGAPVQNTKWSDSAGWGAATYYESIRYLGDAKRSADHQGPGGPGTDAGPGGGTTDPEGGSGTGEDAGTGDGRGQGKWGFGRRGSAGGGGEQWRVRDGERDGLRQRRDAHARARSRCARPDAPPPIVLIFASFAHAAWRGQLTR